MNNKFTVRVYVNPSMLQNPYTERYQRLFGGFSVHVGDVMFPIEALTGDFGLVLLLNWNREIHKLAEGKTRGAQLIFTNFPGEIWVRKTAKPLWKVSCVDRLQGKNTTRAEVLCIPERLEAGLLSVSRKLLAGAQKAGIWTPDCAAMERFLRDPEAYVRWYEEVTAESNNQERFSQQRPSGTSVVSRQFSPPGSSRFSQTIPPQASFPPVISNPAERRGTPPILCPRCSAVLKS